MFHCMQQQTVVIWYLLCNLWMWILQETFQQYKRNENIPEFPHEDSDKDEEKIRSMEVRDSGEKNNLLSDDD